LKKKCQRSLESQEDDNDDTTSSVTQRDQEEAEKKDDSGGMLLPACVGSCETSISTIDLMNLDHGPADYLGNF
jgi:hypothetical protein